MRLTNTGNENEFKLFWKFKYCSHLKIRPLKLGYMFTAKPSFNKNDKQLLSVCNSED